MKRNEEIFKRDEIFFLYFFIIHICMSRRIVFPSLLLIILKCRERREEIRWVLHVIDVNNTYYITHTHAETSSNVSIASGSIARLRNLSLLTETSFLVFTCSVISFNEGSPVTKIARHVKRLNSSFHCLLIFFFIVILIEFR